jgi:hypothetical protein
MKAWSSLVITLNKRIDDPGNLIEASWPAMKKKKRNGIAFGALLVDKVNVKRHEISDFYGCQKLRKLIKSSFDMAPVIDSPPYFYQSFDLANRWAFAPRAIF